MARTGWGTLHLGTGHRETGHRGTGQLETGQPGTGRRWLARAGRACVLTALVASVAGCVGMPNSGTPITFGATPQGTTSDSGFIGAIPAGPAPTWNPSEIVAGFLNASATYPTYSNIAKEYLVTAASKTWTPTSSVQVVDKVVPAQADIRTGGRQATVDVSGTVQASFNGTGQYVGAQQSGGSVANQQFHLVKVDGQWRITNPLPQGRMLTEPDFASVYKPQDLYFFDPEGQVLVPDSVFVPAGTSPVTNLVEALLNDPQSYWLTSQTNATPPAVTAFPPGSRINNVAIDGTTATVNLGGAAATATDSVLEQISAQLVWTLTGQQESSPIQAVQLERNGNPWIPANPPCAGGSQSQGPAQKLAMYSCYNPYPAMAPASFYYVGNGQAWSRCASESQVTEGSIGSVVPVFGRTGAAKLDQYCGDPVQASSPAMPPPQPRSVPALSRVAVSPGNQYAAGVSVNGKAVYVWASGGAKPSSSIPTPGVTALSWDRSGYLWLAQDGATWAVPQTSDSDSSSSAQIPNAFGGKIIGLGVAPDGVRVAAIAQTDSGRLLELAAIDHGAQIPSQRVNPTTRTSTGPSSIGQPVRLGPNITDPIALTWYDADDLLVLEGTGNGSALWEVPVDGQPATKLPAVLPGAISITADGTENALVVGLSDGGMEVSASLEGPWQLLGSHGQNPAFPGPAHLVPAQS
jgi:hypothetical protein